MNSNVPYDTYMCSPDWRARRKYILSRDNGTCYICGNSTVPMDVHHLTYARFGAEQDDDLVCLCRTCHERVTDSWHTLRDGIETSRRFNRLVNSYNKAFDTAHALNVLTPMDITFGGAYVLSSLDDINAAAENRGFDLHGVAEIQRTFNKIHVLDLLYRLNNGTTKSELIEQGYPCGLVTNINKRKQKHEDVIENIDESLVCYIHEGKGVWIPVGDEDGLDTKWRVRFAPSIRFEASEYLLRPFEDAGVIDVDGR